MSQSKSALCSQAFMLQQLERFCKSAGKLRCESVNNIFLLLHDTKADRPLQRGRWWHKNIAAQRPAHQTVIIRLNDINPAKCPLKH